MQTFIGTKVLKATPMNRREYVAYRGWTLPHNENGDDLGFLVEYEPNDGDKNDDRHEGYISWTPEDVFHKAYDLIARMNFGHALEMLKRNEAVARRGWNGKGMFLYLVPANAYPAQTGIAKSFW